MRLLPAREKTGVVTAFGKKEDSELIPQFKRLWMPAPEEGQLRIKTNEMCDTGEPSFLSLATVEATHEYFGIALDLEKNRCAAIGFFLVPKSYQGDREELRQYAMRMFQDIFPRSDYRVVEAAFLPGGDLSLPPAYVNQDSPRYDFQHWNFDGDALPSVFRQVIEAWTKNPWPHVNRNQTFAPPS